MSSPKLLLAALIVLALVALATSIKFRRNKTYPLRRKKPFREISIQGRAGTGAQLLGSEYHRLQENFYFEAVDIFDGVTFPNTLANDPRCKACQNDHTTDINMCFAVCLTDAFGGFGELSQNFADTAKEFFCKPLGFKFDDYYPRPTEDANNQIWTNYKEFAQLVEEQRDTLSLANVVEAWMSNILFNDRSPLVYYSNTRTKLKEAIGPDELEEATESTFPPKCTSLDLSVGLGYLVEGSAAKKNYFADVLLRGLFSIRSAAFYSFGAYQNLAGVYLEALQTILGRKCAILPYALNLETPACDGLGAYPFTNFPIPEDMLHLVPGAEKCDSSL